MYLKVQRTKCSSENENAALLPAISVNFETRFSLEFT